MKTNESNYGLGELRYDQQEKKERWKMKLIK